MAERFVKKEPRGYRDPLSICSMSDDELAKEIRESTDWDLDYCRDLCYRAGMLDEWVDSDEDWEALLYKAAETLGVDV